MATLDYMRTFIEVAESGCFVTTALRMDVTSATVSRHVRQLEKKLQTQLLSRTTRQVALTARGRRYLDHCKKIVAEIDSTAAAMHKFNQELQGRIRIHSTISFGSHFIIPAIKSYRKTFPNITFELSLANCIPDFVESEFDLAIAVANSLPDSGLISKLLCETHSILCASPEYIKTNGMPASPGELLNHECIRLAAIDDSETWLMQSRGKPITVPLGAAPLRVNASDGLTRAVASGIGIGCLPAFEARPGLLDGTLIRVLPGYHMTTLGVYALYPSRLYQDMRMKTWLQHLCTVLPQRIAMYTNTVATEPQQCAECF